MHSSLMAEDHPSSTSHRCQKDKKEGDGKGQETINAMEDLLMTAKWMRYCRVGDFLKSTRHL